jgi:hypothetical protein
MNFLQRVSSSFNVIISVIYRSLNFKCLVPKEYTAKNTLAEFDYSKPVEPILVQYSNELLPDFNDSDNLVKLAKM